MADSMGNRNVVLYIVVISNTNCKGLILAILRGPNDYVATYKHRPPSLLSSNNNPYQWDICGANPSSSGTPAGYRIPQTASEHTVCVRLSMP